MEKLLTVAVPCFNVEWCLEKCLSSFITEPLSDKLEVIVVNDGSTDNTRLIALKYIEKYPSVFRMIDKPNGGHGSAINEAIKQATGKYFNAVDADDWVLTNNLAAFIDILSDTQADAIITHFHTVDFIDGTSMEYKTRDIALNVVYSLDEFTSQSGDIYPCTVFHGLTYRTDVYRKSGTVLSEGIYYEDQEYATFPFLNVETVLPLDLFLNQYLIGNVNQSVSDENHVKRIGHVEHVVRKIFCCYRDNPNASIGARRYIARKAKDLLFNYYIVALLKNPDKKGGRASAKQFREEMYAIDSNLVEAIDREYRIVSIINRAGFGGRMLERMKKPAPYALYRKLFKRNRGDK